MIKKGSLVFLLIFAIFLGLIAGVFIGRHIPSAAVTISAQDLPLNQVINSEYSHEIGKININTASTVLLQSLPNIGEVLAQRIVDYRAENGDFACIEDLLNIKGIGETKLDAIRQYITVGG